jgi:hypothetical protein
MLRDDDEFDPVVDCGVPPVVFQLRPLDDHLAEHEGPKQCRQCGETIRGPYHCCR